MHPGSFCYRQFTDRPDGVNRSCIHITRLQTYQCGIIQWWYLLRNDPSLFISGYPYQVVQAKTSKYQGPEHAYMHFFAHYDANGWCTIYPHRFAVPTFSLVNSMTCCQHAAE